MSDSPTTRILDATANRVLEGLRVVEDYTRFVLDDAHLTQLLKQLRHALADACETLPTSQRHAARDTEQDVGTKISTKNETARADAWDVCRASCERVKQSLRSLEEYSKVASPTLAAKLEALRYQFYTIERSLTSTQDNRLRLRGASLCVLIDGCDSLEAFTAKTQALIDAGVPMIQLRDKQLGDAELMQRAKVLVRLARSSDKPSPNPSLQGRGTTLIIVNDRPDIAAAADADGVHLGQDDLTVKDARTILGPHKLIGVSTHNLQQARAAVLDGADYLGAGPTFPSTTKEFTALAGPEFLKQLAAEISLPTFAIGGIDAQNLAKVLAIGISRVAVSGAVAGAANPRETASQLLKLLSAEAP